LVDICRHHVSAVFAGAAEFGSPRFDFEDPALISSVRFDFDSIAGDDDMPLLGRQILQDASDRAAKDAFVVGSNDGFEPVDSNNRSFEAALGGFEVDALERVCGWIVHSTSNGSSPGQFPFAADALGANGIDILLGFAVLAGQVAASRLTLMSFAKLDSMFIGFLGGHVL
jgi:hypothetical protein